MAGEIDQSVGHLYMKNNQSKTSTVPPKHPEETSDSQVTTNPINKKPVELGGPKGPEPTRYGDWEKAGRCSDF
jgi:hypothetical protein